MASHPQRHLHGGGRKRERRAVEFRMAYTYPYARPALTVDIAVFHRTDDAVYLLLILRGAEPDKGKWALPGGYVDVGDGLLNKGEDLLSAAHRELAEETGLQPQDLELSQVAAFGNPDRDERWRIVTVLYAGTCETEDLSRVKAGDDAQDARWFTLNQAREMQLAFDHGELWRAAAEAHFQTRQTPETHGRTATGDGLG